MENILWCLSEQTIDKNAFEVILVEDRGGTEGGRKLAERFSEKLNIRYLPLPERFGIMGFSRNYGLERSHGTYVLFLDDDTVILQRDFLQTLIDEFERSGADAVIPRGMASFCLYPSRYDYHDPYFPTSRCTAYRRDVLRELGGFVSSMIGQEDVEFTFRFIAAGKRYHYSDRLEYLHPPLILESSGKARAVGVSFAGLRDRYPLPVWIMLLLNGLRFLPMFLFPLKEEWKMMGRFSMGFLMGILSWFRGEEASYR
jgi:cellulose synthase/poly-beta-1,6-N-acetylglucosamine synthase-like glycosyltransferase